MKLNVTVTQEDIERGGHACFDCPVHRAIARTMGPNRPALAVRHEALLIDGGAVVGAIVDFPADVEEWICDYDAGIRVGPISFELELP